MTTYIQQSSTGTHSCSIQFQVYFSSCFNFSSHLYDIYFVNIYMKHSKICKKKSIFLSKVRFCCCCLVSFELSAFANCYIEMSLSPPPPLSLSLSLSLSVCVLCLPLHIVMHLFSVHFICQNLKNALHSYVTSVCKCVCVCVSEHVGLVSEHE